MNEQSWEKDLSLYDWDFVDPPPNEYFCGQCREVFKKPMIIECCGGIFCSSCIEKRYGNLYRCPDCKKENIVAILDKRMWNKILELDVKCPFNNHGCPWTGELKSRAVHLAEYCNYVEAKCKFGCGEKLEIRELTEHLEYFCPNRPVICPHCSERGKHEFINGKHKDLCLEFPVDCPNKCESSDIKRRELETHLLECQLEVVECEYTYAGCGIKMQRKDLSEHLQQNMPLHMAFMTKFLATELEKRDQLLQKVIDDKDKQLQQLAERHIQELKEKDEMIAQLMKEKTEELELEWKQKESEFKQQLDKIVDEFEHKYKELRLNINHLPEQVSTVNEVDHLEQITLLHRGKNNAEVWLGKYKSKDVAIKKPSPSASSDPSEILREARVLNRLLHTNIVTLHNTITTGEPVCMVLEYMPHGNLKNYLEGNPVLLHQQISICKQVACGLEYLQRKLCIHRCVRIDNVLVGENLTCKINDFSSAIFLQKHDEEYLAGKDFEIQVKWSAPEVVSEKRFCLKSDVWSYGILMWQVATGGQEPYHGLADNEAEECICAGNLVTCPQASPPKFYTIMLNCWKQDPHDRLTFESLADLLDHVLEAHYYTDVK